MRSLVYSLGIRLYTVAVLISSLWNEKAGKFIQGRKNLFDEIKSKLQPGSRVWFHCSSVGEFEQARPLIEDYRQKFPDHKIILTFFSPSGYELRKNYAVADAVFYLPVDTKANARKFLDLVKPSFVVFVKYDLWWNFLDEIFKRKIPGILISAIFRKNSWLFNGYGKFFMKKLNGFSHIFLQDENSLNLLKERRIQNISVAGDTRFDRVISIASHPKKLPLIEAFKNQQNLFVAGSTWPEDEKVIFDLIETIPSGWKFAIVPHEMEPTHLESLKSSSEKVIFYSELKEGDASPKQILIVDRIGFLSSIYQYAKVAYIGGGFGRGIHNILEAAVYGVPVIFGPNYFKFNEAKNLVSAKGAFSVRNGNELRQVFQTILINYDETGEACKNYVQQNAGATQKIMNWIIAQAQNGAATTV